MLPLDLPDLFPIERPSLGCSILPRICSKALTYMWNVHLTLYVGWLSLVLTSRMTDLADSRIAFIVVESDVSTDN
jgi:hypothetical protein